MTNEGFGTDLFYYFPFFYFQTGQPPIPKDEGICTDLSLNSYSTIRIGQIVTQLNSRGARRAGIGGRMTPGAGATES